MEELQYKKGPNALAYFQQVAMTNENVLYNCAQIFLSGYAICNIFHIFSCQILNRLAYKIEKNWERCCVTPHSVNLWRFSIVAKIEKMTKYSKFQLFFTFMGQVRSGQVRSGQVRSGQVRSGQVRSGQVRSGQVFKSKSQGYFFIFNTVIDQKYVLK